MRHLIPDEHNVNHDINSILIEPTFTELPELRSTASLCVKLRNKRRRNALDAAELLLDHRLARPQNWPPACDEQAAKLCILT